MLKKSFIIILAVIICLNLCSCYDSMEADEENYAIIVGIDRNNDNTNLYTVLCPEFLAEGKESTSDEESRSAPKGYAVYSVNANSLNHAISEISSTSSRNLSLSQVKTYIVSDTFDERKSLTNTLDDIFKHEERSFGAYMLMSENNASDFIGKSTYSADGNIASELVNQIKQASFNNLSVDVAFIDFYTKLTQNKTAYLPKCSLENNAVTSPVQGIISGIYMFDKNNSFVQLESDETQNLLIATTPLKNLTYSKGGIDTTLTSTKPPKFKSTMSDNRIVTVVDVYLDGKLYSDASNIENTKTLLIDDLTKSIHNLYDKYSKQNGLDIMGIKQHLRSNFTTVTAFEAFNFQSALRNSVFKININLSLRSAL